MTIKIADKVKEVGKLLDLAEKHDVKITDKVFSCVVNSVYDSEFVLDNENDIQGFK